MTRFWHPVADMSAVVRSGELVLDRADGVHVWDVDGNRYLDATAGLWYCNVGYGREEIAAAAAAQLRRLPAYSHYGDVTSRPTSELAERIAAIAPMADAVVFFTSGGGESVETAVKLVRRYWSLRDEPSRTIVVSRERAYHGLAGYGTSIVGADAFTVGVGPLAGDTLRVPWDDAVALASAIDEVGTERVAAFFCEPIVGAGGVLLPPPGYLEEARRVCRERDVLFVADEVICGFGRVGDWFASTRFGLDPDVVTFAKGVTSGYVPLGGVIVGARVREPFWAPEAGVWRHGYTYSGHATATAAAHANLDIMERESLPARARGLETELAAALAPLAAHQLVAEVRARPRRRRRSAAVVGGAGRRPDAARPRDARSTRARCPDPRPSRRSAPDLAGADHRRRGPDGARRRAPRRARRRRGLSEMEAAPRRARLTAARREEERVTPLELFFDLVFVLALTQCTALMAADPTWGGLVRGLLVLGVLWWSWVGYAWLTSVVDPEEGAVRLAIFAAMAALLVAALCVPGAFGDDALPFVCAYGIVRVAQIWLFTIASRGEPALRRSVTGLAGSTAIAVTLLLAASATDGWAQSALWAVALLLDMGGPFLFGAEGWQLMPGHFAERHGLIVIIALGESIVAIGIGSSATIDAGVVIAATLGIAIVAALWWLYFDVSVYAAERRLAAAARGREQNELARDAYSYLHFPMVAGIVLLALGLKKTLEHVGDPLDTVPAFALVGGVALYLLAHVAFRLRHVRSLSRQRLIGAALTLAVLPLAVEVPAVVTLVVVLAVVCAVIGYEVIRFAETRDRIRHEVAHGNPE